MDWASSAVREFAWADGDDASEAGVVTPALMTVAIVLTTATSTTRGRDGRWVSRPPVDGWPGPDIGR